MPRQYVSHHKGPKWSPERGDLWVEAYRRIGNVTFACDAVGITPKTFYDWMHKGELGDPEFEAFYFAAKLARSERASSLISAAERDKGGPAFLLERLFPAEFGVQAKAGRDALQLLLELVMPLLTDSARLEILNALELIERRRAGDSAPGMAEPAEDESGTIEAEGESVEPRRLESGSD